MNLINIILFLIIIIFLINYFSNGQIFNTLKRIFNNCKQEIENFTGKQHDCIDVDPINIPFSNQLDFPNQIKSSNQLYSNINKIVLKNYDTSDVYLSYDTRIKASRQLEQKIINNLLSMFDIFSNIKLNQILYYCENKKEKYFEPFLFTTENITFIIDCFLRDDKLFITNLKIIKKNNEDKILKDAIKKNQDNLNKMQDTFNDISINTNNDLFIQPPIKKNVVFTNDTDDSLIPSIDDISI